MAKRIIIGLDTRDLQIAKTGTRTYLEELCNQFKLEDARFQFFFLDTDIPVYTGKNKLLKLVEHLRFIFWKQIDLPIKAIYHRCDIVCCTDYFVPFFHPGFITIPVFHDAFFWEYPSHYNKYWLLLFKSLGIWSAKRSPYIITPSFYTRKRIHLFSGIPLEKIISIYEAPKSLPLSTVWAGQSQAFDLYPVLAQSYLLHVGTFEKRKNLPLLIRAFTQLTKKEYPWLKLVLIGQASPKKDMDDSGIIADLIKQHKLEEKVIVTGYVSDEVLPLFYQKAMMYVFPSINEGFGIPVLEAFANNLPLIIANNSCLPEVAGEAALTFDPFSEDDLVFTMKKLIDDPELRKEMIKKGNTRLSSFSWEKTAGEIKSIFIQSLRGTDLIEQV